MLPGEDTFWFKDKNTLKVNDRKAGVVRLISEQIDFKTLKYY